MEFHANDYGRSVQCQRNKSWIRDHESLEQFKSECGKGLPLKKRLVMNFTSDDILGQFDCVCEERNQMNHDYYESVKHLPFRKRFITGSFTFVAPQHSSEFGQRFSIAEDQHWNAQTDDKVWICNTETDQEPLDLTIERLKGASEEGPKRGYGENSGSTDSYSCCVCHKQFDNAKKHKDHQHRHLKKILNAYRCNICGKTYGQKSSLNGHMRHHTNERPYKCRYCDRAFTDQSTFTKHERVHTKVKPYVCKVCSWAFTQSGNLLRHERTHEKNQMLTRGWSRAKMNNAMKSPLKRTCALRC